MSEVVSVRLPDEVLQRLRARAAAGRTSISGLAQQLVDEGLRMDAHPGITFRSGPAGRRAALVGGPDVWEAIGVIRSLDATGDEAVAEAADWLGLDPVQIRAALSYYGEYPDEVDEQIAANDREAERARRSWEAQRRILT